MEFAATLDGMYGWLLAGLITIVCTLSLTLIYLMIRRMWLGHGHAAFVGVEGSVATAPGEARVVVQDNGGEWKTKAMALEVELKKLQGMKEEYENLQQKIKFLESKLLEYEILQEEIGTLSTLKVENEKLRKEIVQLETEIERSRAVSKSATATPSSSSLPPPPPLATPAPIPQAAAPMPTPPSPPTAMVPDTIPQDISIPVPDMPTSSVEIPDLPNDLPPDLPMDLPVIPPLPDLTMDAPSATMSSNVDKALADMGGANGGFDSLLTEIEELSQPQKKTG